MCVAFPMKVIAFEDDRHCTASYAGVERKINTRLLPDCRIGDYILVHAGYAIERVSPKQAEADLELFHALDEAVRK